MIAPTDRTTGPPAAEVRHGVLKWARGSYRTAPLDRNHPSTATTHRNDHATLVRSTTRRVRRIGTGVRLPHRWAHRPWARGHPVRHRHQNGDQGPIRQHKP